MEDEVEIRLDETVIKLCSRIHKAAARPNAADFASLRDEVVQRWRTQSSVLVAFSEFVQIIKPESVSLDETSWAAFFAASKVEKAQENAQRERSNAVESNRILRKNQILKISMSWSPEVVQRYGWGKLGQSKIKLLSNCMKKWPRWDDFVGAANLVLMLRHCAAVTTARPGRPPSKKSLVGPQLDLKVEDLTAMAKLSEDPQWIYGEKVCIDTVGERAKDIDAWATDLNGTIAIQGRDCWILTDARCLDTIQSLNRWRPTDFSKYLLKKDENGILMSRNGSRAASGPHIDAMIYDRDSSAEADDSLAASPNNSDDIPFPETTLTPSSYGSADCLNYAETPTTPPSSKTLNGPWDMLEVPEGVRPTALSLSTADDTTCWPYNHGSRHGPLNLDSQGSIPDASSALQAEILEHHSDPTITTGMSKEKEIQALSIAMKDHSGSRQTDGSVSSGEVRSSECRHGINPRKRKRAEEKHARQAESFGMDSDLEQFEQAVDEEKEKVLLGSGAWTPRGLLEAPDVGPLQFFQALPTFMLELNDNEKAKRLMDVKQRIAMAHFYRTYTYAKLNREMFVRETDGLRESGVTLTPLDGLCTKSAVKRRLIDIDVWQSRRNRKEASNKINNWNRCGKPWADLITSLGYGSLPLVPSSMSNTMVHAMPKEEFSSLLTAIEARKSSFADSLARASTIMEKLFSYATPPLIANCPYSSMQPDQRCEELAWYQPKPVMPIMLMDNQNIASPMWF